MEAKFETVHSNFHVDKTMFRLIVNFSFFIVKMIFLIIFKSPMIAIIMTQNIMILRHFFEGSLLSFSSKL